MRNKFNILHITDLHINDISIESDEYLRTDNYESYLGSLCSIITNTVGNIHAVVVTGDFVDKGKVENFDHAEKIIKSIYLKLNLNESNIGVCPGNHDFKVIKWEGKKIVEESNERYLEFERKFTKGSRLISEGDKFYLSTLADNMFFLGLDSCSGRLENKPGKLSNSDFNKIMTSISNVPDDPSNLLIIASHYPLSSFDRPYPDIDGWYDHHIWRSGLSLKERMKGVLKNCKILWLCGDTHIPGESFYKNQLFIMSGRIGTKTSTISEETIISEFDSDFITKEELKKTVKKIKEEIDTVHRQARVISYEDSSIAYHTFEYTSEGTYVPHPQYGNWTAHSPKKNQQEIHSAELIELEKTDIPNSLSVGEDDTLDGLIASRIYGKELYQFGQFPVDEERTSLGWISMNSFLSTNRILVQLMIMSINRWIKSKLKEGELHSVVLIGLDIWGAVIASQLSVLLDVPNHSKMAKTESDGYTPNEVFQNEFRETDKTIPILITDVVSSGKTLSNVYKSVRLLYEERGVDISKALAVSIINDNNQQKMDLSFLDSFGTCCSSVKIPIVNSEILPPSSVIQEE